jgi:hypothetical protein
VAEHVLPHFIDDALERPRPPAHRRNGSRVR